MSALVPIFYFSVAAVFGAGASWLYWDWRLREAGGGTSLFGLGNSSANTPEAAILKLRKTKSMFAMLAAGAVSVVLMQLNKTYCFLPMADGNGETVCEATVEAALQLTVPGNPLSMLS